MKVIFDMNYIRGDELFFIISSIIILVIIILLFYFGIKEIKK